MSRAAAAAERVVVALVGLVLLVAGAAAVGWERDWIPGAVDRIDASEVLGRVDEAWWPWAVGLLGLVLVGFGVAWLRAHSRRRSIARLDLHGSGRSGKLSVDSGALVAAASEALEDAPGVTVRGGRIWRDQRELVIELRAAIDPGADLGEAADAAEQAAAVLGVCLLPQTRARCRVVLVRAGRRSKKTRVR